MNNRAPIPSELRRRVLIEAGHRCSIPACRRIDAEAVHIVPPEAGGTDDYENLVALCPGCRERLRKGSETNQKSLYQYKTNLRFMHDKFSRLEVDLLFECAGSPGKRVLWSPFNAFLLQRLVDARYVDYTVTSAGVMIGGLKSNPDFITLSKEGAEFIASLGEAEL